MDEKLQEVKVGDVVLHSSRFGRALIKVDGLTRTTIKAGGMKFRKESGFRIGSDIWSTSDIKVPTEEEIQQVRIEVEHHNLINRMTNYKWSKLPLETLRKINALLP